jgi:hypothetical protein
MIRAKMRQLLSYFQIVSPVETKRDRVDEVSRVKPRSLACCVSANRLRHRKTDEPVLSMITQEARNVASPRPEDRY